MLHEPFDGGVASAEHTNTSNVANKARLSNRPSDRTSFRRTGPSYLLQSGVTMHQPENAGQDLRSDPSPGRDLSEVLGAGTAVV